MIILLFAFGDFDVLNCRHIFLIFFYNNTSLQLIKIYSHIFFTGQGVMWRTVLIIFVLITMHWFCICSAL